MVTAGVPTEVIRSYCALADYSNKKRAGSASPRWELEGAVLTFLVRINIGGPLSKRRVCPMVRPFLERAIEEIASTRPCSQAADRDRRQSHLEGQPGLGPASLIPQLSDPLAHSLGLYRHNRPKTNGGPANSVPSMKPLSFSYRT